VKERSKDGMIVQTAALFLSFAKGIPAGGVIAMLPRPVGRLCVRPTVFEGWSFGLLAGLGIACATAIFGLLGGFGLSAIRIWIGHYQDWLGVAGGVYLLYAGVLAIMLRPDDETESLEGETIANGFAAIFATAIRDPVTAFVLVAIFAELGIHHAASTVGIALLVAGSCVGSALWWPGLSMGVMLFRGRSHCRVFVWINRLSGGLLGLAGIGLLAAACFSLVTTST
jgi:threonine/homoserine/homoserine lactone efflux protein